MAEVSPPTAAPVAPSVPEPRPNDLRIVLFGLPAAGKTSLLGALGQASAGQEHLLAGRLLDPTHGLAELRQRTYEEAPRRTADEVVPYPVSYEPFNRPGQEGRKRPVGAIVIDCDGRVANDLLVRRQGLDEHSAEGTLAHEVLEADALLLIIDASAPPTQVEADFAEFDRFLRQMEAGRAGRAAVAGLPVFVVLTKCDLLAQPGDNSAHWMERIEDRKRDVDARFRDFFARREQQGAGPAFGSLALHVWATAVKRPGLLGAPSRPREPYGVAELFRLCLDEAGGYRARARRAHRRLLWTVGVAGVLIVGLVGLSVGLIVQNRARQTDALQARVEDFRALDRGTPAERLRGSVEEVKRREEVLQSIRDEALFSSLNGDDQKYVRERLEEAQGYLTYRAALVAEPRPGSLREESALAKLKARLQGKDGLALPSEEWADTEAGRLHKQMLADARELQAAVVEARKWYEESKTMAEGLWLFEGYKFGEEGARWPAWTGKVEELLAPDRRPPFDARAQPYSAALLFDSVRKAREKWEVEAGGLRRLLDATAALGLAPAKDRPAVFRLASTGPVDQLPARLAELKKAYPRYKEDFNDAPDRIDGLRLSDVIRSQVHRQALDLHAALLERGQAEVKRKLGARGAESADRWAAVRAWLQSSSDLAALGEVAEALAPLARLKAKNPVRELVTFLSVDAWVIEVRTVTLAIPDRLDLRPDPKALLKVNHPKSEREPALTFKLAGSMERDASGRVRLYRYRPVRSQRIVYRPGEKVGAYLKMADSQYLKWLTSPSRHYLVLRLREPPRLLRTFEDDDSTGSPQTGVRLTFAPEEEVPAVPDLMPRE